MLKAIEVGLLAVSILVFMGLIITAPARRRSRAETEAARISADPARPVEKKSE
jgi:hypothetical protein